MCEDHCLKKCLVGGSAAGMEVLTLTFPKRLAMEEATSIEMEDMMLVVKKSDPSFPSWRLNLLLKNHVTHDLNSVSAIEVVIVSRRREPTVGQDRTRMHPTRRGCTD
jgi:hypothetical protein